jgi:mRNA interferase MazF
MRKREIRDGWVYRRGDIYMADLNPFKGSEQGGKRPVLVLQNNDGNIYCPTLIVAPLTTQLKTRMHTKGLGPVKNPARSRLFGADRNRTRK